MGSSNKKPKVSPQVQTSKSYISIVFFNIPIEWDQRMDWLFNNVFARLLITSRNWCLCSNIKTIKAYFERRVSVSNTMSTVEISVIALLNLTL